MNWIKRSKQLPSNNQYVYFMTDDKHQYYAEYFDNYFYVIEIPKLLCCAQAGLPKGESFPKRYHKDQVLKWREP